MKRRSGGERARPELIPQSLFEPRDHHLFEVFTIAKVVDHHALAGADLLGQMIQAQIQRACLNEGSEATFQQLITIAGFLFALHLAPECTKWYKVDVPLGTSTFTLESFHENI